MEVECFHCCHTAAALCRRLLAALIQLKLRVSCLIFLTLTAGCCVVEGTRSNTLQHSQVLLLSNHQYNVTLGNVSMLMGQATQ